MGKLRKARRHLTKKMSSLQQDAYIPVTPDASGYINNSFPGKKDQLHQVCDFVTAKGFIPADLVQHEVNWFYGYGIHTQQP